MFCASCGAPLPEGAQFCLSCGNPVGPSIAGPPPLDLSGAVTSPLTSASHLVMLWDKLGWTRNYQFQDESGTPLGETRAEGTLPLRYTLLDNRGQVVLTLDAVREHGLAFAHLIHDAAGTVLASLRVKSSFMSRRYGITVGQTEGWYLVTDATGYRYQIEEGGSEQVLATGIREMALRTSRTTIDIREGTSLDHRIVLGSMIFAELDSTRR